MERKIVVITGGSRGIGLEAAKALSGSCVVYELSRRGESHDGITHISCDVSDVGGVSAAIDAVIEKEGKIDILICSAGYGISGAVEPWWGRHRCRCHLFRGKAQLPSRQ